MSRHNVRINGLSVPQAEYLCDAIEADLDGIELTPEGRERAKNVLAKIERALSKVKCDGDACSCRQTPSERRANSAYRARLAAELGADA